MGAQGKEAPPKTSIWKLSDEDSHVYLAGSVHLLREEDLPFPPAFETAYQDSSEIVFEIDMRVLSSPSTALRIRQIGTLPEGKSLSSILSPKAMEGIREYLKNSNLPPGLFDSMTPGMVYLTMGSMEATRQGAQPELGMESQFFQKAQRDKKSSRGLETPEYQMSRFNEFDDETIEGLIQTTLDEVDEQDEDLNGIIKAWKAGDLDQLDKLVAQKMAEEPELKRILLTERNQNWIPEIEKALAGKENIMFLVGTAHLVGEDSVIDLLEKNGLEVNQVGTNN
tara:strand:+ start:594 stop:1436 length:843 start_codon:yes stop_codon:yes gene_type:complete